METVTALVGLVLSVFVAIVVILAIPTTREWVGLGGVTPTGVPGFVMGAGA